MRGGGGGGAGPAFGPAPFLLGGVGAAKGLLPCFLVPTRNQPTACTLALWWLKFGPTECRSGVGGGVEIASGGQDVHYTPPPPTGRLSTEGPCQGQNGTTTSRGGTKSPGLPRPFSASGSARNCQRAPPTANLLGSAHVHRPQRGLARTASLHRDLPHDFPHLFHDIAQLPSIRPPRRLIVIAALQHMALAFLGLRGSARGLALLWVVLNTILQSGLFCESDGYYDCLRQGHEPGHHARVTDDIAGKSLGEVGALHIAHSIRRRLVPRNLRKQYTKCTREAQQPRFAPHSQHTVGRMLESVRVDTRGMRHTQARVSSSVFLRYKNAEKCRLLLNAVRINASDHGAPKAVRLPTLSHLAHTIKGSTSGRWLCKMDLQNCYWSIRLPRSWHRVFVVQAGHHRYKYTRLSFGWRYSPSICQTLVKRLVA